MKQQEHTHLILQRTIAGLGGAKVVADKMRRRIKNSNTVYQWTEDPEISGRVSPVDRVLDLCELAAKDGSEEVKMMVVGMLRDAVEMLGCSIVPKDKLAEARYLLVQLSPDSGLLQGSKSTTICKACDNPVVLVRREDGIHTWCNTCKKEVR